MEATITGKRKIEKEYQMTQYDDVLDIIDAEVTLVIPGDIFTNEGDDVVTVINSTLTGPAGTSLFLGSGDDTREIAASTLSLAAVTGVGSDYVIISDGETAGSVTITEVACALILHHRRAPVADLWRVS